VYIGWVVVTCVCCCESLKIHLSVIGETDRSVHVSILGALASQSSSLYKQRQELG
jgi:hypothetical protein